MPEKPIFILKEINGLSLEMEDSDNEVIDKLQTQTQRRENAKNGKFVFHDKDVVVENILRPDRSRINKIFENMFLCRNDPLQLALLKNHPHIEKFIRNHDFHAIQIYLNKQGVKDAFMARDQKHLDDWVRDDLIIDQLMQNCQIQVKEDENIPAEVSVEF